MEISRLTTVDPRLVWSHEALKFTPWLAQQIDRLGEAIGDDLEVLSVEAAVGRFSADIFARSKRDGRNVLIENQLEQSDHKHLGQILTYMAGLDVKTVVWLTTRICEEHVSAIEWLNSHTPAEFRFFAVELRVVRIGDSPVAPIFEIVARPNDFERTLKERKVEAEATKDSVFREFWSQYLERYPEDAAIGFKLQKGRTQWLPAGGDKIVGVWLATYSGVYVRGLSSVPIQEVIDEIGPHCDQLESMTGATFREGDGDWLLVLQNKLKMADRERWPEAIDWIHRHARQHLGALEAVRQTPSDVPQIASPA